MMAQASHGVMPLFAQQEQELSAIKKIIENIHESYKYNNLDSYMANVSANYSIKDELGNIKQDYAKFKTIVREAMDVFHKTHINYSYGDIKIINPNIGKNVATIEVTSSWKAFNLRGLKEVGGKVRRAGTLTKENGVWKIIRWQRLEQPEQ